MKTINQLMDIAKDLQNIPSDRQLAAALKTGSMTRYRKGHEIPSDTTAIKLAELCSMKPETVVAICHAAKAKTKEEKSVWSHIYKMAAAAAVGGLVVSGGVSALSPNTDKAQTVALSQIENGKSNAMDIMSSYKRELMLVLVSIIALFAPRQKNVMAHI